MISDKQEEQIQRYETLIHAGSYEAFSRALADHHAMLSRERRTQDSDYWKELGRRVHEPGFRKLVLEPLGIQTGNADGFYADFTINGIGRDLKFECAPFLRRNPEFTRTIDFDDTRKYTDEFEFLLWHVRQPGILYRVNESYEFYTGRSIDIVCTCTVGQLKRLIKRHGLVPEGYKERKNEPVRSGNEGYRYEFDIRWFKMLWRYENLTWSPSAWTKQELGPMGAEDESDEMPTFVSRKAAGA